MGRTKAEEDVNRAINLLAHGDYEEGFKLYEERLKCPPEGSTLPTGPMWRGEPNQRVLLINEGGMGDAILGLRYLEMVKARSKYVTFVTPHKPLNSLIPKYAQFILGEDKGWDCWCSLFSLPHIFRTTTDSIPPPFCVEVDSKTLDITSPRVGVRWFGSPKHGLDRLRSIPLCVFSELFEVPHINFISLHETRESHSIHDLSHQLTDLSATAKIISNCDMVVTVDTSVAHLAGTMNKETWLLLPSNAYWVWMFERDDTPWYPSVRLIRMKDGEDWRDVIKRTKDKLTTQIFGHVNSTV